jgi:hypothetical protein
MDVVVAHDHIGAAIDEAVNALQAAGLLAAQIEADQPALRPARSRSHEHGPSCPLSGIHELRRP